MTHPNPLKDEPVLKSSAFYCRKSLLYDHISFPLLFQNPYHFIWKRNSRHKLYKIHAICLPFTTYQKTNHRAPSSPYTTPSSSPPRDHEPAYTSDICSGTASDSGSIAPSAALKLEELLPLGVLNKLSPGNLKRATDEFLTEWEKSLGGEQAVEVKDKAC